MGLFSCVVSFCMLVNLPTSVSVLPALNDCSSLRSLDIWSFHLFPLIGWCLAVRGLLLFYRDFRVSLWNSNSNNKNNNKTCGEFAWIAVNLYINWEKIDFFWYWFLLSMNIVSVSIYLSSQMFFGKALYFSVDRSYSFAVCS